VKVQDGEEGVSVEEEVIATNVVGRGDETDAVVEGLVE
jgi:hypothetical protein